MPEVIWSPQPRQREFQRRWEYEALYGGAAGGGKSDALLVEALRQVKVPHYRAILFRKTYPQLTELIDRSIELYRGAFPRAVYNASGHVWTFPSGAKIYFGNMQHTKDRHNYQGKRYDFIGFDELTHFTWDEYSYLMSRNRPGGPGTRVYLRATSNPGGIGHGWVKDRFITAAPPMTTIWEEHEVRRPDGSRETLRRSRIFVPATVFDNRKMLENDPNYLANLAMMPEAEKNALLYGDWNSFEGQVFREWRNDPEHYEDGLWTHVIQPFKIPPSWRVWRGFDFGYSRPFSVGWYAADPDGKLYRIREYYGNKGPNIGLKLNPVEIAEHIREIEREDPNLQGRDILGVADPAIFEESRGPSIADMMAKHPNYVLWRPGDNTRLAGKMQLHNRLAFDERGECMLQVFDTCQHFIRTVPDLCYDESNVEDVDTDQEDHIYDECRYVLMESPISPRPSVKPPERGADPLDQREERKAVYFRRY